MRELKFRIWQPTKNYIYFELAKGNSFTFETTPHIEQYTGLKDKNGKEIYEGDIIKEIILGDAVIWIVRWDENECCYSLDHLSGLVGGTEVEDSMLTREDEDNVEVIGNIHENLELLEYEE